MRLIRVAWCVVALTACSDDPAAVDAVQFDGEYTLQTIDGRPLPFELFNLVDAFIIEQVAGTMTLNANHTFREEDFLETRYTDVDLGPVVETSTVVFTGRWESRDSSLTLTTAARNHGGTPQPFVEVLSGFVSENRLTLRVESGDSLFTYVYQRN